MTRSLVKRPRTPNNAVSRLIGAAFALCFGPLGACHTGGSDWMAQPLDAGFEGTLAPSEEQPRAAPRAPGRHVQVLGAAERAPGSGASTRDSDASTSAGARSSGATAGVLLGTFKNTYYDFPNERDFEGETVSLMSASCKPLASVPRTFFESVCVQGSGTLQLGGTVSFAKRDCACAPECPRTGQHICFDLLDRERFPWGRGATGKPVTPLLTVAVDSSVIALGTALYIPEYDGVPRDPAGQGRHDGCFIAEDRGLSVAGKHVDIFTGQREVTALWNRLVPTNSGVTVVADSPRCQRGG